MRLTLVLAFVLGLAPAPSFAADNATAVDTPKNYKLGLGDKLRIEVYRDTQLSQSVQVRPDGKITLPLVGDIEATGKTPIELRDVIAKQLKDYMTNPVVTVIVVETKVPVAYVMGEVNHPGSIALPDEQLTVLQALALAGGLKDFADTKNIQILRRSKTGAKDGPNVSFNYKDAIRGGAPVYIYPGDTVVVPD